VSVELVLAMEPDIVAARTELLYATAGRVLSKRSPIEEFSAWLQLVSVTVDFGRPLTATKRLRQRAGFRAER
jgi:hypothetical protein